MICAVVMTPGDPVRGELDAHRDTWWQHSFVWIVPWSGFGAMCTRNCMPAPPEPTHAEHMDRPTGMHHPPRLVKNVAATRYEPCQGSRRRRRESVASSYLLFKMILGRRGFDGSD